MGNREREEYLCNSTEKGCFRSDRRRWDAEERIFNSRLETPFEEQLASETGPVTDLRDSPLETV